ncbi:MAG: hypothetical protein P8H59_08675 [Flavobacteriales bacterium]|nr:hypothetical protein [Flavobacteriales bacterium]MDG1781012.1 hypothetical protein [Flavobacteriales bacterium]MDG2245366.1 hypothetical protein [Flavobacteriales bacterium]
MTEEQEKMSVLIQLVKADGLLAQEEQELLLTIASKAGISEEELTTISAQKPGKKRKFSPSDKIKLFYQSLLLANADGEISDEETMMLHDLGTSLGLDMFKVQILIQNVKEEGKTALSEDDLENVLQL